MTDKFFRLFLDLLMASDPWPLEKAAQIELDGEADRESVRRGFDNWIVAFHEFSPCPPEVVDEK